MSADELLGMLDLTGTPRRVLVIEDHVGWLHALTGLLEARGHSVIPMIGVFSLKDGQIEGPDEGGEIIKPMPKVAAVDVLFLDYNFVGGKFNGATFLLEFRQSSQAVVMGMSSDYTLNQKLLALGATMAMTKGRLKHVLVG